MANKVTNTQNYTDIATAIRNKLGVQTTYMPSQMAAAIASIPTGSTFDYMIPFGDIIYGTTSGTANTLGTKTIFRLSNSMLTTLGVKKIRIRGKLEADAEQSGRVCTATLSEALLFNDGTSTQNLIKELSSGTASSSAASATWNMDKTYDIVTSNIKEIELKLKSVSNGASASAPIDRYTRSMFGNWGTGTTIDGIMWYGATAELIFD